MQNQYASIEIETDNDSKLADQNGIHHYSYEKILSDIKLSLIEKIQFYYPDFSSLSESDPLSKTIEIAAYRELLIRQKIKDTINASLLSQSSGSELDKLASLVLDENKKTQNLAEKKTKISTFWTDQFYTTGTKASYVYFVNKFGGEAIRDVKVVSKNHAVTIYILLHNENEEIDTENFKKKLQTKLEDENIRRITDKIDIQFAKKIKYTIKAELSLDPNYSLETIQAIITEELKKETDKLFYLNKTISTKLLFKVFYKMGVKHVELHLVKIPEDNAVEKTESELKAQANEALCWNNNLHLTSSGNKQ